VIFQPKDNTKALTLSGNGSGTTGELYAPAAQLSASGNAVLNTTVVVDTMTISQSGVANTVVLSASAGTVACTPGVSVVSMSWGFPEGQTVFGSTEATYDETFEVAGATFVASTGDYGSADPEYPAFSPNVMAVGGKSLMLNSDGSYNSETEWRSSASAAGMSTGSGGGVSLYEPEPAYQRGVQSALSGQVGPARPFAVSKAQALPNGAPGSRHALALPRTVRQDHRTLATARPRTILVSDSVLDDLAADLALVRGCAPDGKTDLSTLSESGVADASVVITNRRKVPSYSN
jgi:hypothetical protein